MNDQDEDLSKPVPSEPWLEKGLTIEERVRRLFVRRVMSKRAFGIKDKDTAGASEWVIITPTEMMDLLRCVVTEEADFQATLKTQMQEDLDAAGALLQRLTAMLAPRAKDGLPN